MTSLMSVLNDAVETASVQEIVETLSVAVLRQAAVKGNPNGVNVADYLRGVADNIGAGKLTLTVASATNKKSTTSAANGKLGGRPKGSKNKTTKAIPAVEPAPVDEGAPVGDALEQLTAQAESHEVHAPLVEGGLTQADFEVVS